MSELTDDLLKVLIQVSGRVAIEPKELRELVAPGARGEKQEQAYNLCDGTRPQADIAKALGLDSGNFSRTLKRWEQLGVLFRLGPDQTPLHLYPLTLNVRDAR